jgi:hypothetical protein
MLLFVGCSIPMLYSPNHIDCLGYSRHDYVDQMIDYIKMKEMKYLLDFSISCMLFDVY